MPTDLTGTPTSLGIGTYNTSADAPSGLGFNAAMAQIDTLLAARVTKPAGVVSGEVPVWNGSTWVRSSVTNVGPSSLGSGTPDNTKFLRGDGSWQIPAIALLYDSGVLGADTATVDTGVISGIANFKHIKIIAHVRSTLAVAADSLWFDFNADATSQYQFQTFYLNNNVTNTEAGAASITHGRAAYIPGANTDATNFGSAEVLLPSVNDSTNLQEWDSRWGFWNTTTLAYGGQVNGRYNVASAVNRFRFSTGANIRAGSQISVYGLS